MAGKSPTKREALVKEYEKEVEQRRSRTPTMCTFVLSNSLGCQRESVPPSPYCARHIVIDQMIQSGSMPASDLMYEAIPRLG